MFKEKVQMVRAKHIERKPIIKELELSEGTLKGKWDFHKSNLHGIITLNSDKKLGNDCKIGFIHLNEHKDIKPLV